MLMRGGSSRGPVFLASDLPEDGELRDRVLLAVMGSPDPLQIDGVGGADPLTSRAAIVSRSLERGVDVDYLFAQVLVDQPVVDVAPNCGNMLAAVAPFAIERGLVAAADPLTRVTIRMVNTGTLAVAHVATPGGRVTYTGDTAIAGVPNPAAEIRIDFQETAGSVCGALLPTDSSVDRIEEVQATLVDNGMPLVVLRAVDFGLSGYEAPAELDAAAEFKARLERVRLLAGERMGLGDVSGTTVPKMALIAPPRANGHVTTRMFTPHDCHAAIGVLGAVSVATACALSGSIARGVASVPEGPVKRMSVEHRGGEFTVEIEVADGAGGPEVVRSSLVRTARALFEGHALIPAAVWSGRE
jgi:4-oxalomesaconate tautomerase